MNTEVVNSYIPIYVKAFLLTLKIGWVGVALAFILGIAGAFVLYFKLPVFSALTRAYVELFRNTPLLVQLFFIYYGLPVLGFKINAEICGAVSGWNGCSSCSPERKDGYGCCLRPSYSF